MESRQPSANIVRGQRVSEDQLLRAKRLRREMTPAETLIWDAVRTNRLDGLHFRRQQPIGGFFVDFYCHAAGVVVEIDGGIHARQQEYDAVRDDMIAANDLLVLRFSNEEVTHHLDQVLRQIAETCRKRITERGTT